MLGELHAADDAAWTGNQRQRGVLSTRLPAYRGVWHNKPGDRAGNHCEAHVGGCIHPVPARHDSIAQRGVLQPILLRPDGEDYQIIAGERRWRAAQRARLHSIPAIVREIDDSTTAELALIENVQREDLNAIEEAEGYRQLIQRHGHTQEDIGKIVHKSRSHVANLLRLLDLPEAVKQSLLQGDISMGHARAVATAPDPEELTREIVAKGLSVRQAEARAKRAKVPSELVLKERPVDPDLAALERQLGDMLGLRVQVAHKGQGGTVTLHYSNLDQLDMVCQRLSGEPI